METAGAHEIPAVRTVGDGSARGLAVGDGNSAKADEDKGCHHDGLLESCVVTTLQPDDFVSSPIVTTQRDLFWERALVDLIY
jgi:hypothetical protein